MVARLEAHGDVVTIVRRPKVLCVDDDRSTREMWKLLVEPLGLDCHTAENGADALYLLRQWSDIGLVVTDFCMPVMDGGELCEAIERDYPDVKVVVISGSAPQELTSLRQSPVVAEVLEKPVQPVDFLSMVYTELGLVSDRDGLQPPVPLDRSHPGGPTIGG
jgi:two-component system, cell cycle response regulator CpdR